MLDFRVYKLFQQWYIVVTGATDYLTVQLY